MAIDGRGKALMAAVLEYDLEGPVAKRKRAIPIGGMCTGGRSRPCTQAEGRGDAFNFSGRAVLATVISATDERQSRC
jgi:hypothetical protein